MSAYGAMFVGAIRMTGAKQIWKASAPPRVKYFFWLAFHERCWTADRRHRHGLQDSGVCIFCDQEPETIDHLLLNCVFSREVWKAGLRLLHLDAIVNVYEAAFVDWWLLSRKLMPKKC